MRSGCKWIMVAVLACAPLAAGAGVVLTRGGLPAPPASRANGVLLRVISKGHGNQEVTIATNPAVRLRCEYPRSASTVCTALVRRGTTVEARLRKTSVSSPGTIAPRPENWRGPDCRDAEDDLCVVTMDRERTVEVTWAED